MGPEKDQTCLETYFVGTVGLQVMSNCPRIVQTWLIKIQKVSQKLSSDNGIISKRNMGYDYLHCKCQTILKDLILISILIRILKTLMDPQ